MFVTLFIAPFTLFNLQASSGNQRVFSAEELNKPHPSPISLVFDLNSEEDPNVASAGGSLQKQEAVSGEQLIQLCDALHKLVRLFGVQI